MIHMESILETSGICYLSKLISLANNIENWKKSELGIECLPQLKKRRKGERGLSRVSPAWETLVLLDRGEISRQLAVLSLCLLNGTSHRGQGLLTSISLIKLIP